MTLSQASNTCGLSGDEEVDPIAEEWAARLAAQREGREYTPSSAACSAMVVGGAMPGGCGAGAVPQFGAAPGGHGGGGSAYQTPGGKPPEEEAFDGFGGFEEEVTAEYDERAGGWSQSGGMGGGGMGGGGMGGGGMGGGGMGRAPQAPQVPAANWGDLGLLAQPGGLNNPTVDYGELDRLGQPQQARQEEELNWGILGEGGGSSGGGGAAAPHDDDDDDIPIFDGFQDNKPVLGGGGGGGGRSGANTGEGLSWDAERGLWKESKPRSAFSGMSSSWDLRSAGSAFKSPTSLVGMPPLPPACPACLRMPTHAHACPRMPPHAPRHRCTHAPRHR